jgi:hypothetical protein
MNATATSTAPGIRSDNPAGAFTSVLNAAVGSAATKMEQRVVSWTDKLNGIATGGGASSGVTELADAGLDDLGEGGGAKQTAGAAGVKASMHGKSPFWAAVKGAWRGGTPVVRAAIVAALVATILLLLVSPVLLLVFLLSLLVIAAVQRARAAKK